MFLKVSSCSLKDKVFLSFLVTKYFLYFSQFYITFQLPFPYCWPFLLNHYPAVMSLTVWPVPTFPPCHVLPPARGLVSPPSYCTVTLFFPRCLSALRSLPLPRLCARAESGWIFAGLCLRVNINSQHTLSQLDGMISGKLQPGKCIPKDIKTSQRESFFFPPWI